MASVTAIAVNFRAALNQPLPVTLGSGAGVITF